MWVLGRGADTVSKETKHPPCEVNSQLPLYLESLGEFRWSISVHTIYLQVHPEVRSLRAGPPGVLSVKAIESSSVPVSNRDLATSQSESTGLRMWAPGPEETLKAGILYLYYSIP